MWVIDVAKQELVKDLIYTPFQLWIANTVVNGISRKSEAFAEKYEERNFVGMISLILKQAHEAGTA
jgi:hypothetical protein